MQKSTSHWKANQKRKQPSPIRQGKCMADKTARAGEVLTCRRLRPQPTPPSDAPAGSGLQEGPVSPASHTPAAWRLRCRPQQAFPTCTNGCFWKNPPTSGLHQKKPRDFEGDMVFVGDGSGAVNMKIREPGQDMDMQVHVPQKQLIYAMPKPKPNPSRSGPHSQSKQNKRSKAAGRPSEKKLALVLSLAVHIARLYYFHKLHY
ncbi:hypothetical protein DL98DRAFT_605588 [Cadophora sp. DSE1049]|nr:hypothetical protein DL98DRAFT_605588 [Cadophora sp. DSE1049]